MTAIIGFNLGSYALLIADTRKGVAGNNEASQDGFQKIYHVGFGMISGAGSPAMIKAVVGQVHKGRVRDHFDIPGCMEAYHEKVLADCPDLDQAALDSVAQTQVIATTVERAPSGLAIAHVFVAAPTYGFRRGIEEIRMGHATICGPSRDALWEDWMLRCNSGLVLPRTVRMEREGQPEELVAHIEASVRLGTEVMASIAASNRTVSPTYTIGLQYSPTEVRISEPSDNPPDPAWLR